MLLTLASSLNKESQDTPIIFSNGMLVKRNSTSRLVMERPGSWSAFLFANLKLFFTVYTLALISSKRETRNLARLCVGLLTADMVGLKGGLLSTKWLCTLQRPGRIPNLKSLGIKLL